MLVGAGQDGYRHRWGVGFVWGQDGYWKRRGVGGVGATWNAGVFAA